MRYILLSLALVLLCIVMMVLVLVLFFPSRAAPNVTKPYEDGDTSFGPPQHFQAIDGVARRVSFDSGITDGTMSDT